MGKEVPLARPEEEGQPMLLAGAGSGGVQEAPSCRNKRKKEDSTSKRPKRSSAKDSKKKSKGNPASESGDGERYISTGYGGYYSSGQQAGESEGRDNSSRRSSKELVEWVDSRCSEKPYAPHSHWWIGVANVDSGTIFTCKFCHQVQWLPNHWSEAYNLGWVMDKFGNDEGYRIILSKHPKARKMLMKLNRARRLRKMVDEETFIKLIVVLDKEDSEDDS